MQKVMISPSRYVQGPGTLREAADFIRPLGRRALVIVDRFVLGTMGDMLQRGFNDGLEPFIEEFGGECSRPEIDRLAEVGRTQKCQVAVGVGGGKAIDTAKAVAHYLKIPVCVVPTIAATDAPCSALSVIYTPEGVFAEYLLLPSNPNLVLMDSEVIAHAPPRFLVSGMGDAMATYFEADAAARANARTMAGGVPTLTALSLARLCYDTLLEYGLPARLAAEQGAVTPALEKIIEANTLLSGLGFESGGLAAAHAIHNGFTALPETHGSYHGEKVAFATIVQLVMEDRPTDEIYEVLGFCDEVGLPMTLARLGVGKAGRNELRRVAETATAEGETIHNMPFPVNPGMVVDAILAADALGRSFTEDEEYSAALVGVPREALQGRPEQRDAGRPGQLPIQ